MLPCQWESSVQFDFTVWQYSTTFWNIPNQCILPTLITVTLSLRQVSPVQFYCLTVQYYVQEHPKPVHLARTVYSCLVNETVQSSSILPFDSTVPRSGTSKTSTSCTHSLLLPCQWASSFQFHFTVWQYSTMFWNIPNQSILPTQFPVSLSMSQLSPATLHRLTVQYHVLEHPKLVHLASKFTVALSMKQFSPVPLYHLTLQQHVVELPKPVHLAHRVYCCLVNETVQSSSILPSDSTEPLSGTSQTSPSCPHSLLLTCQVASSVQSHFTVWQYSTTFRKIPNQSIMPTQFTVALSKSQFSPVTFYHLTVQHHVLEHLKPFHLSHTVYCCLVNEPVQSSHILPSDSTATRSRSYQTSPSCPHSFFFYKRFITLKLVHTYRWTQQLCFKLFP